MEPQNKKRVTKQSAEQSYCVTPALRKQLATLSFWYIQN